MSTFNQMIRDYKFTICSFVIANIYWLIDSALHKFVYGEQEFEFVPTDIDELWMRMVIIMSFIGFGVYVDYHMKLLHAKEKEKREIYLATAGSAQHIINNLLNQMQLFKMEAEANTELNEGVVALYDNAINEGKFLVKKLSSIDVLTREKIKQSVYPESSFSNTPDSVKISL